MGRDESSNTIARALVEAQRNADAVRRREGPDGRGGGIDAEDLIAVGGRALASAGLALRYYGHEVREVAHPDVVAVVARYSIVHSSGDESACVDVEAWAGHEGPEGSPVAALRSALTQCQALAVRHVLNLSASSEAGLPRWERPGFPGSDTPIPVRREFEGLIGDLEAVAGRPWADALAELLRVPRWYRWPHVEAVQIAISAIKRRLEEEVAS